MTCGICVFACSPARWSCRSASGSKKLFLPNRRASVDILLLARHRIQIERHLGHAAELNSQNALKLILSQKGWTKYPPSRPSAPSLQGPVISAVDIHVQQAGHDLVIRVERCPDLLVRFQPIVKFFRICPKISIRLLAFDQLCHQIVGLGAQRLILRARVHQRTSRKIVPPREVPTQFAVGSLPSAQRLSRRGQDRP